MANVWHTGDAGGWIASSVPLDSRYVILHSLGKHRAPRITPRKRVTRVTTRVSKATTRVANATRHCASTPKLLLVRTGGRVAEGWFVIPYPSVRLRLNGGRVTTGLARLADRDVMSLDALGMDEWVFTTERLAEVEVFAGEPGLHCPRCKLALEPGQSVVACPGCRALHHQDEGIEKPCWTYAPGCSQCGRDTSMAAPVYSWTPDEL